MTSWRREMREHVVDETHVLLSRRDFDSLDTYDSIGQPTSPSIGRAFKTRGGLVVFVEPDPDPAYVRRVGRLPLFLEDAP